MILPRRTCASCDTISSSMGDQYRSTPDKASLFQIAPRAIHHRDAPQQQLTQIGRALKELNIEWIAAHSPQAKGRIERAFQTAQDRLVKGLRQVGANDLQTANAYLQQVYVPLWNRRFTREPRLAGDAHRALLAGTHLESVLKHPPQPSRRPGSHASVGRGGLSGRAQTE